MAEHHDNKFSALWHEVRQYFDLNVEYAKLTVAEKTAILLTAVATATVCGVLVVLVFFFISLAIVYWLGMVMSVALAYTIMGAFYVALLVVAIVFRRQLIINPISRFISKLFLR